MPEPDSDRLYFRQLLAGRDFAASNPVAAQMVNFCYLIGDRATRDCVVVDPAWDVAGLVELARRDDMEIVGALATQLPSGSCRRRPVRPLDRRGREAAGDQGSSDPIARPPSTPKPSPLPCCSAIRRAGA